MKGNRLLFVLVMVLAGISFKTSGQTTVPFEMAPSGHILIKARVNNVEGNFILDTGGGLTLLTKKFSEKLTNLQKLDREYTAFRATGEKITADLYTTDEIKIADFTDSAPFMMIYDVDFGPIDGLISLMTFRNQPFTIDYDQKKVIIETPAGMKARSAKGNIIPLQVDSSRDITLDIFTFVKVNGKLTLQFLVDSGAGNNVFHINSKHMKALGVDAADTSKVVKIIRKSEFNDKIETAVYKSEIQQIAAKDYPQIRYANPKVSFIDGLIYDGTMSLNWFGKQITIDMPKKQMIVGK
jgi:predicted aspartyl protease